jgi:hypothetical protein
MQACQSLAEGWKGVTDVRADMAWPASLIAIAARRMAGVGRV